jgi:predicted 2-oxoglutarate/Fe(II)-dependent dioxygenase YbiX
MKPYPETDLSKFFTETIRNPIEEVSEDYRSEFLIPTAMHEPYSLLKYLEQAEYKPHHDHAPDNRRVYSMVSFLSTSEEGGQLEFPLFDVTVEAICGRVIMFPSNFPYLHIAHPVTKGVKHSLVTWYQG